MATEAEIQAQLTAYQSAVTAILTGAQSYKIGTRQLTRADLATINKEIERLESRLAIIQNGGQVPGSQVVFGGHRG